MMRMLLVILCFSWAAFGQSQEAVVISEKAVIYADQTQQSPIGYLPKGKVIKVGKVARNKGQVLPTIINEKVVYISVDDISSAALLDRPDKLEAIRFREHTLRESYQLMVINYSAQQTVFFKDESANVNENMDFTWAVLNLKGVQIDPGKTIGIVGQLGYGVAENSTENVSVSRFDVGVGPAISLIDRRWSKLRLELLLMYSPLFKYELNNVYDESGGALGSQASINWTQFLSQRMAVDFQAGLLAMKVYGLDMPDPSKDYNPTISGAFFSIGVGFRI